MSAAGISPSAQLATGEKTDALLVGHSYIRRLSRYLGNDEIELEGQNVKFWGFPGATIHSLRRLALGWDLTKFSVVYIELGTNDLCGTRSAEAVAQDLLDLVHLLQGRGATKLVLGEIINRGKMRDGGPSVQEVNNRVIIVNNTIRERAAQLDGFTSWKHERLNKKHILLPDGVHFTNVGMHRYWRSVRGALVASLTCIHLVAYIGTARLHSLYTLYILRS